MKTNSISDNSPGVRAGIREGSIWRAKEIARPEPASINTTTNELPEWISALTSVGVITGAV